MSLHRIFLCSQTRASVPRTGVGEQPPAMMNAAERRMGTQTASPTQLLLQSTKLGSGTSSLGHFWAGCSGQGAQALSSLGGLSAASSAQHPMGHAPPGAECPPSPSWPQHLLPHLPTPGHPLHKP